MVLCGLEAVQDGEGFGFDFDLAAAALLLRALGFFLGRLVLVTQRAGVRGPANVPLANWPTLPP